LELSPARRHEEELKENAVDAILDEGNVEVDQIAEPQVCQLEIGSELECKYRMKKFGYFQFDHDPFVGQQIKTQSRINNDAIVLDGEVKLGFKTEIAFLHFMNQASLIDSF